MDTRECVGVILKESFGKIAGLDKNQGSVPFTIAATVAKYADGKRIPLMKGLMTCFRESLVDGVVDAESAAWIVAYALTDTEIERMAADLDELENVFSRIAVKWQ